MSGKFESFGSGTSDNDVDNQSVKSGQQIKDLTLSSLDKTVSQIDVLPSLRIVTPVSGEARQKYFFFNYPYIANYRVSI